MGRALVRDPVLFLFDEPLSNLDAKLRVEMRTEIKKLHHRLDKTTVYVTHDQVEAMTLASRIAVMHKGVLQQFDEPRDLYERPANIFVAGFMGSPAMNFFPAETVAADGGPGVAIVNGGKPTVLPLPGENGARLGGAGRQVVLGIRPEHIIRHDPERPGRREVGLLAAPVEVVEPTGAETMAVLRVGEREVIARFEPDERPAVGEPRRPRRRHGERLPLRPRAPSGSSERSST